MKCPRQDDTGKVYERWACLIFNVSSLLKCAANSHLLTSPSFFNMASSKTWLSFVRCLFCIYVSPWTLIERFPSPPPQKKKATYIYTRIMSYDSALYKCVIESQVRSESRKYQGLFPWWVFFLKNEKFGICEMTSRRFTPDTTPRSDNDIVKFN